MVSFRHPLSRALSVALVAAVCLLGVPAEGISAPALADVQGQASAAKSKLADMQGKVAQGVSAYSSAAGALASTRSQIASNKRALKRVNASLDAGEASLGIQAEFLYRTDGAGFVDVLLASASFEEFASRLSVLQIIASKDAGLVANLKQDRIEQQQLLSGLRDKESRQQALVTKVAAQRDSLQSQLDAQESYYHSLSGQVAALIAAQEQAAKTTDPAKAASSGDPIDAPPAKAAPPKSSGKVALKQVKVSGKSGTWWAMASDHDAFSATGVKFSGEASIYSVSDNGTGTSSGRPLNDSELTCAHRSLPFGTRIAVSHGGRRIIVVVTDRGPYTGGRVLDLTPRGADLLGIDGVGNVTCEVVDPN